MSAEAAGHDDAPPFRIVLLLGFMASGKTTVGRRVARLLGWEFVDFDREIETRAGARVEEIFAERGEAAFRTLEAEVGRELLTGRRRVLAAGGGWPAVPGRMDALGDDVLSVWLKVDASTAVERSRRDTVVRPLLEVDAPVARATELLRSRRPFYGKAAVHLDTDDAPPEDLARRIVALARGHRRPTSEVGP